MIKNAPQRLIRFFGKQLLIFPPAKCRFFPSVDPIAKLFFLFVVAGVSFTGTPVWKLASGLFIVLTAMFLLCSSRKVVLFLLLPISLMLTVVATAMLFLANKPIYEVAQYVLALLLISTSGLFVVFSFELNELASGIERMLAPLSRFGVKPRVFSLGVVLSIRFFVLLAWSVIVILRAFETRNITLRGFAGMKRFGGALLVKVNRIVDDLTVSLVSRGVDFSCTGPLLYVKYSTLQTATWIALTVMTGWWMIP